MDNSVESINGALIVTALAGVRDQGFTELILEGKGWKFTAHHRVFLIESQLNRARALSVPDRPRGPSHFFL